MKDLISTAIEAAYLGGLEILDVYDSDFAVETKNDKSPLTLADKRAHLKIVEILGEDLPVLSEEGKSIEFSERADWDRFWMVDPLDGTKEFVKRNGEFTVNIALIEDGKSVGGVIYVPVKKDLYFGAVGMGSYKISNYDGNAYQWYELVGKAESLPASNDSTPYRAVGSRSHMSPETEEFFEELKKEHGEIEIVSMGSSLKICLVAEGSANVYPRFAPTMEWDTAAGHAIAKGAGKNIMDHTTQQEMRYNKENLLNNWFIVN
ncbi:3'(2'),5'-bisphosphate nucleotidase CysQ [Cryomorphaceae bacterium 1068]|nr:3'(2'),5'-bisphosphate nucleotidase CysQ [Cryomorphaceae bacterium 1068]